MPDASQIHRPRREHSRLRLNIPAALDTPEGEKRITLLNLSQGGARIRLSGDERVGGGVLKWMDKKAFGVGVWQIGSELGLKFHSPIHWDWVVATRHWRPTGRTMQSDARTDARRWAGGVNQSKFDLVAPLDEFAKRNKAALDIHKLRGSGARARQVRLAGGGLLLSLAIGLGVSFWSGLL